MGKRKGGYRRGSRQLLRKHYRCSGKVSLTNFLASYTPGEKVVLKAESAYQKGMFHVRFAGRIGTVSEKRGRCYEVLIHDGSKEKKLVVHPVHLKRL
ncbi:MAG: 50S ribosomal protein L21e [Candidatus Aenigmarchaeota archaeon]|nr:50S ribosomal protein L21e [Candidatus Aenigmarchaeota archaeon]